MSPLLLALLTMLIIIFLLTTSQDIIHWLIRVGIRVRMSKYNIDDGVSMDLT